MSGIMVVVTLTMAVAAVCAILRRSIYISRIIKASALMATIVSVVVLFSNYFAMAVRICDTLSPRNGAFVFMVGGSLAIVMLFLAFCGVGQLTAKKHVTF